MPEQRPRYYTLDELVSMLDEKNRLTCKEFLTENHTLLENAYGSIHNHQSWMGGYLDHIQEIMNIAIQLYPALSVCRELPFKLPDALLVLFLHDIEKPWKYEWRKGLLHHTAQFQTKSDDHTFRTQVFEKYRFFLTAKQFEALEYVEGEIGEKYSPRKRGMSELAAFCHLCDVTSARIWHNNPLPANDPWKDVSRTEA